MPYKDVRRKKPMAKRKPRWDKITGTADADVERLLGGSRNQASLEAARVVNAGCIHHGLMIVSLLKRGM